MTKQETLNIGKIAYQEAQRNLKLAIAKDNMYLKGYGVARIDLLETLFDLKDLKSV